MQNNVKFGDEIVAKTKLVVYNMDKGGLALSAVIETFLNSQNIKAQTTTLIPELLREMECPNNFPIKSYIFLKDCSNVVIVYLLISCIMARVTTNNM